MDKIIYSVRLDVQSIGVQAILHGFSVGDVNCRQICVSLSQRGKTIMLDGTETALMYVKKDGAKNPTVNPCTIKGSTIVYEVTQDDCSVEGQTEFTVKVQKDGVILYAPSFVGIVKNPGVDGASNPSGPEYTLIETLIDDIQSLNRRLTYIEENGVSGGGGGVNFETGDGLVLEDDVLKVDDSIARISDLDYEKLENIPTVDGIEVKGSKTLADFSLRKMVEIEYDDYMLLDEYEPNTVYLVKNDPSDGSVEITDEQIASAIENYLNEHPISGTVTPEDIAAAVEAYLTENPISGVTSEMISEAVNAYLEAHPISLGIAVSPIAPPTDGTILFWINSSLLGESDEPTDVEMVPNGTWQLKSSEPIKYVIIGTDDDNTGNAKFLRLCRTYGIPYTMNMASGTPNKNIQGDADDSIFTDSDAPSVFPNYVTPLADVAKYIVENDLGEVALHGFQPLWDSDEWTDDLKTEIYNQYVSDGGTRSKDDFVQAVLENASATDWAQGGTITRDTKAILESDIDHQVYTLGIWGGGTSTTVDGINVSLSKVQNKGTSKDIGAILKGYNFFGAGTVLNHYGNTTNYNLNRWSAGLSHLDEGLEGIRYGQCLEFFYHYPIGDETPANLRTYFTQLKQYESEGKIKLVTRKQYVMECGEWVENPIKNISINREMTQVGTDDDDSLYTVTAYYADDTQADVTSEAIIDKSAVDTSTVGKYKIEAYYRGFAISGYAEITDSAYAIESVIINNESVSGGAIDRYTDFGDLPMTGEANATYLIEADYKINVTLGPGQHDLMAAAVWTGVNDYNNYATFYLLTREDEARTELIGHISEVVTSNRSATRNWLRFNGGSNIAIDSYEFTNIKISKLRAS